MRATLSIFASLAAFLFNLSRAAAATEIPCEFRDGLIWVKVSAGKSAPLSFLLDSGAGTSVLDLAAARRIATKLGLPQSVQGVGGRGSGYRVEAFAGTLADVNLAPRMVALDLSQVSRACGRRIDGLIGADFFRSRIVQIDFARQRVRLLGSAELGGVGPEMLPLASRGDALCVRIGIDGNSPAWMRVDTGCDSALRWVVTPSKAKKLAQTSIALATGTKASLSVDVQLGSTCLSGVKAAIQTEQLFAGEAGLLGNGLLSRFTVTIDASKGRLFLMRN